MQSGIVVEKTWVLSTEQMLAAGIAVFGASHQFAEHTSQIQWFHWDSGTVVDQTGTKPPNSACDLFLVQVWLWAVLWGFFSV